MRKSKRTYIVRNYETNAYREKFGCLEQVGRVWAVSSIHGELDRLIKLHDTLVTRWQHGDRLVYLGNYLDRGPDIKGVLDELLSFRINRLCLAGMAAQDIVFLRGAQEEMWRKLLQIQLASDPNAVFDWMAEHGIGRTLEAYGESEDEARKYFREGILATTKWTNRLREKLQANLGHSDILVALRRAAYTEGGELLFAHAGIDPNKAVIDQNDTFWWGSSHFDTINKPYSGFQKVICGYDQAHRGITETAHTLTIDGGCGHGGPLYTVCFNLDGNIADQICID